jgi:RNA polymerase sigma factor (TIGR02999 family)
MEAPDCTGLLRAWSGGDRQALDRLVAAVHGELRQIAKRYTRREKAGQTLQTADLVNEAYLRLIDVKDVQWQHRAHFFAIAAQIMRRILVDRARGRGSQKRGGGAERVGFEESMAFTPERPAELLELDEALTGLAAFDPRKAQIVELRYFGGLDFQETATVLDLSERTVLRDWKLAKAWLAQKLAHGRVDAKEAVRR